MRWGWRSRRRRLRCASIVRWFLLQSDDWGVPACATARDGRAPAAGLNLGEKPYDFYSLETAEDVHALAGVLRKHRDATGRRPSIVMNFIMANVDFDRWFSGQKIESGQKQIPLCPLTEGWPGHGGVRSCSRLMRRAFASGCFIRRCMG